MSKMLNFNYTRSGSSQNTLILMILMTRTIANTARTIFRLKNFSAKISVRINQPNWHLVWLLTDFFLEQSWHVVIASAFDFGRRLRNILQLCYDAITLNWSRWNSERGTVKHYLGQLNVHVVCDHEFDPLVVQRIWHFFNRRSLNWIKMKKKKQILNIFVISLALNLNCLRLVTLISISRTIYKL